MVGHACPGLLANRGGVSVETLRTIGGFLGSQRRARGARGFRSLVLLECRVSVLGDDDVLKHGYPEESPGLLQPVRDVSILRRWRRVSAWVIVRDNNRGGIMHDCGREDVAGMNYRGVGRAN